MHRGVSGSDLWAVLPDELREKEKEHHCEARDNYERWRENRPVHWLQSGLVSIDAWAVQGE